MYKFSVILSDEQLYTVNISHIIQYEKFIDL